MVSRLHTLTLASLLIGNLQAQEAPKQEAVVSQFAATLVQPFYPPLKQVEPFQPPSVPAEKWSVQLSTGAAFKIEDLTQTQTLDGPWKISGLENNTNPFPENADVEKGWHTPEFNDSSWDTITVPLDWYQKYSKFRTAKNPPYVKGWYRKTFEIPTTASGKRILLTFDVAGYEATLFVNGQPLGSHHGDFTPWTIDITKAAKIGEKNVLALRVFSDFGPKWGVPKAKHAYGSQWSISNIKGGLWQSVRLSYQTPIYIKRALISPNLGNSSIEIDYVVVNTTAEPKTVKLNAAALAADKVPETTETKQQTLGTLTLAPGETTGKVTLQLRNPMLWSPDRPTLYNLFLALESEGKAIGAKIERFGFRDFKVKGKQFVLNGEPIYLFGANLPSVRFGGVGLSREDEIVKVANLLKELRGQGYNIIRTAHSPVPPFILSLADEIGMMIYDEWAWAFTDTLDPIHFEKHNLKEMSEWVERDYNHPSVVMWSCGNEVHYDKPDVKIQLNKAVAQVRALDRSGRPVSVFSGAAYSYGKEKLDTDFLDLHTYIGASLPWSQWNNLVTGKMFREFINPVYGENGQLQIPFVVWETVGFSWGGKTDATFTTGDIATYAKYVENPNTWAEPNTIGYSGSLGVAASLDPARGLLFGRNLYGKRISELIRWDVEHFQGFAPWFISSPTPASTLWTQPVFCGLRRASGLPPRNLFEGKTYQEELFLINSTTQDIQDISIEATLVSLKNESRAIGSLKLKNAPAFARSQGTIPLEIPAGLEQGFHQIRLLATHGGKELSRNFYDVYVGAQNLLKAPLPFTKNVGLLESTDPRTGNLLNSLGITYVSIKDLKQLSGCQVVIVPASSTANPLLKQPSAMPELKSWIREGGRLLVLEQEYPGSDPFGNALLKKDNTFVDVILTGHPIFQGLVRENFDSWDAEERGIVVRYPFAAFSKNALAVRGVYPKEIGSPTALLEGNYGKGRIIESQLSAVDLWGKDSSATHYLRNLLSYVVGDGELYANVQPWIETTRDYKIDANAVEFVNLKKYANMGFADETAGDQKGGWTDEGANDFREMPLGKQILAGVPFEIIDPAANQGKSCIVLRNPKKPFLPQQIDSIPVDKHFRKLFFLHTMAWDSAQVGEYKVRYEDGSLERVILQRGKNIGDWWGPGDLPEAALGVTRENELSQSVGMWVMPWLNPHPNLKITSIGFESYEKAVPILVAISGEKRKETKME